jgi:branched-chain amino acid transport system substrate-binding protein
MRRVVAIGTASSLAALLLGLHAIAAEPCPTQCPSGKVLLGVAGPITGRSAGFGEQTVSGVQAGVRALNDAGGLMGVPVELLVGDDRCDEGQAVAVATKQVEQDKLAFVIGPACPAPAMVASKIYAKAGAVQIVPVVTAVELTRQGLDNVFRMVANIEQEAQSLGDYFAREYKGKRLAVVYTDDFYGRSIASKVRDALPPDARSSAQFESLLNVPGANDRLADKLQKKPPDAIYISLESAPFVEFVTRLRKRGVKSVLLGGQHLLSRTFWFTAREAAEGIRVLAPIESVDSADFRNAITLLGQAKIVPDLVALASFASVQVWAEAVRRAGGGDPKKVIQALRAGPFDTAIGRVAFDANGDRRDIRYSVLSWQGGHLRP